MNSKIEPLAAEAVGLAKIVAQLVRQGLSRDEVLARLADPAGVGAKLIEQAIERRASGKAYLGREPAPVLARVEDVETAPVKRGRKG